MTAVLLAGATISLVVTAPADLTHAIADGGALSLLRAIVALVVDLVWSLVEIL